MADHPKPESPLADLGFTPDWFAAGIVSHEVVDDFVRIATASPGKPPRFWRWAAFRDFVEEHDKLTTDECRAIYRLGEAEPDLLLGTAIMCSVLYQAACPAELSREAETSARPPVRRAAGRR